MRKVNIAEEARSIAQKYQEKPEMVNKIELLRKLDQSVTKMPSVISLSVGIIGILIFGLGMCCWLVSFTVAIAYLFRTSLIFSRASAFSSDSLRKFSIKCRSFSVR